MYAKLSQLYVETTRLCIRRVTHADLPAFYQMHSVDEVNVYLPYNTWHSQADAEDWFAKIKQRRGKQEAEQYVLERKHDKKIIGSCIVFNFNESEISLEIGYVLNREFWGHGYMYEAIKALLLGLSMDIGIRYVKAVVNLENASSLKLLSKFGFEMLSELIDDGGTRLAVFGCTLDK